MFEKRQKLINPETASPKEYATLFAGASRKERKECLNTAGRKTQLAYELNESRRHPAERGSPAMFALRAQPDGSRLLTPYDGVSPDEVFVTISRVTSGIHAVHEDSRGRNVHPGSRKITIVPSPVPQYKLEFRGGAQAKVTAPEEGTHGEYSIEQVGFDQYSTYTLSPSQIKHMPGNELVGLLYQLGSAKLHPDLGRTN